MSKPQDDGKHYIKLYGPAKALERAKADLLSAGLRMNGDKTYKAHCEKVVAYVEGYCDGFVDCNYLVPNGSRNDVPDREAGRLYTGRAAVRRAE